MNLLLVEDEHRVADFIRRGLDAEGWSVTVAPDGASALRLAANESFDVILLDLMLPDTSGQDICRTLRARGDQTPILMLTALGEVDDRVTGLRIGADDYLTKPFDFDELLARIDALVRRSAHSREGGSDSHVLAVGDLRLDTRSLEVRCGHEAIELTPKERDLLTLFLSNPGTVYSRERMLSRVWRLAEDPQTNVVDVYIGRLRKKLGVCGERIETVRGTGYRYRADG